MISLAKKIYCCVILCMVVHTSYANMSVPFEMVNGLIILEATINGMPGNYIIDSGSNGILLNEHSKGSNINYQSLGADLEGSETRIESIKVGDFEVSELLGFSTDLSNLELFLDKRIAGILGCSVFTPNSLIFDFVNSKMIISDRNPEHIDLDKLASLSFDIFEDLPIVQLIIEGNEYAFILDSGASSHFIDDDLIDKFQHRIESTGVEKSIITTGGKDNISQEYIIPNCEIGGIKITMSAFEKDFDGISETLGKDISGLLSLSKLSSSMVYFDLKAQKLYYN